ncbi:MAG TPA: hypothetical protein DCM64_12065 [Gammaproteobacteria bacterium]|nr:hypothetical protein [Gammaproteobacteria bacterium]
MVAGWYGCLQKNYKIGDAMRCGFPLEKGEGEIVIRDNGVYLKQTNGQVLGPLLARGPHLLKANSYL